MMNEDDLDEWFDETRRNESVGRWQLHEGNQAQNQGLEENFISTLTLRDSGSPPGMI